MTLLYDTAAALRATGVSVIPTIGKAPAIPWKKFQHKLATTDDLQAMFASPKVTGVAIILGQVSGGLFCRDFDGDAGQQAYAELLHKYPVELATLPAVQTGNGYHVYGRCHEIVRTRVLADGELRCEGGYCPAPPSLHPDTHSQYRLLRGSIAKALFVSPGFFLDKQIDWKTECELWEKASSGSASPAPASPTASPSLQATPTLLHSNLLPAQHFSNGLLLRNTFSGDVWTSYLPQQNGERNACILRLVRALKLHPRYRDVVDTEVFRDGFRKWHEAAKPSMREQNFERNFHQFCGAWTRCIGGNGISSAVSKADAMPPIIPNAPGLDRLARTCQLLASEHDGKFFMSLRTAAFIVGGSEAMAGSRALRQLQRLKLIRLVRRGVRPKASSWKWTGGDTAIVDTAVPKPPKPPDKAKAERTEDTPTLSDFALPERNAQKAGL